MVRNLMPAGGPPSLAVMDHQGLRLGPPLYDLASLLNDTVFLSAESEEQILEDCLSSAEELPSFHRVAAQRTLKAAGTYARFVRQGLRRHEPLIVPTFERALAHLARLPDMADLASWLGERWARARRSGGLADLHRR